MKYMYKKNTSQRRLRATFLIGAMIFISLFMMSFISGAIGDAIVADMTADNAPSPLVASASAFDAPFNPFKAFDNDNATVWYKGSQTTGYLKIDLGAGNEAVAGIVNMRGFDSNSAPKDYTIQGSNNDADWTTLHTVTGQGQVFDGNVSFTNTVAYRYYKIDITAVTGTANAIGIANLQYYDTEETTSSPTVTLSSPVNYLNQTSSLVNFNISTSDLNEAGTIKNVTLYIDGVLNETNSTETINGTYFFSKYLSYGSHNWSILAYNNNSKSTQSATRFITIGIFENSRTYDTNITEGSIGTFVLNLSTGSPVTSAYLSYNGSLKSANINAGSTSTTLTSSFTIPEVSTTTNVSLFWIVYTSAINWNSTSSNQTILNINFDNCSVNKIYLFNFTSLDELSKSQIVGNVSNVSAKLNIQVYPFASRNIFFNYSQFTNRTNPFGVCINSTLSSSDKFSIDVQVEFQATGYEKEYYYIQNETFNSDYIWNNISLYNIDTTSGQTFRLIYLDSSGIPVEDALIEIQRLYVEDGIYRVVEISKTDDDGETQAKLQLNDVIYNFVVKKYEVTLATFNRKFVRCDNVAYDVCEIKLNSFSSYPIPSDYTSGDDFEFTLDYNYSTRTITGSFIIPSGNSSLIVLNATLLDNLGTTLACSDSITSSTGTLTCIVPNAIGNSSVYASIYKDGEFQGGGTVKLDQQGRDIYGSSLVFLLIFLYLTLFGIGISDSPMITGVFLIIGAILGVALNLVKSTGFVGAGATILWLVIAIAIVLIKGGKRT